MAADLKVVPFPQQAAQNIPEVLRDLAKKIEEGEYGEVRTVLIVLPAPVRVVFGIGRIADSLHAVGMLQEAIAGLLDPESIEE